MIVLNCPCCGHSLSFQDVENREFGFCEYCGSKVQLFETVVHKHVGSVNLEGAANVRSLCEKGFHEINEKDYFRAAETFDRAAEIDCNDLEVIIGKSLVKQSKRTSVPRGQADSFITFDEYYFSLLQKKAPSISAEEKSRINEYNCKLFLKLYCLMWDAARAGYVINCFPQSIDMDLLAHEHFSDLPERSKIGYGNDEKYRNCIVKLLNINNPVNVIQLLLTNGIEASTIFYFLYYQAYERGSTSEFHSDAFHSEMLPAYVLALLEQKEHVIELPVPIISYKYRDGDYRFRDRTVPFYTFSGFFKFLDGEVTLLGEEDYKAVFCVVTDLKKYNRCQYCGSPFKGVFKLTCSNPKCGKPKDY